MPLNHFPRPAWLAAPRPSPPTRIHRSPSRCAGRLLALALLLAFPCCPRIVAQSQANVHYGPPSSKPNDTSMPLNDASGTEDQKLLQMRNAARHLAMVADAEKLLRLANELHTEVAAASAPALTPAQLRKLQKIEKLAHKVRIEMAISVSDTQGGPMPIQSLGFQ